MKKSRHRRHLNPELIPYMRDDETMASELASQYDPASIEQAVTERWIEKKAFQAKPDERENRYVVMMPLPNVTGALHMGHAMDNVMQDLLVRWHRMQGDNTLWMAGTDHAGIATQAVVEKRMFELEGKTRHDIGREALVERIWEWKDQYQKRIVSQQQAMGCSCDWDRQRFTMDEMCTRAVRHTFFRMFEDGLIFRGNRLVNWDCFLQTAVADDEIEHEKVDGHFWHLQYPIVGAQDGEPDHVIVATTRPETMLGDTAVACHPEPRKAIEQVIAKTQEKLAKANAKEKAGIEAELAALEERKQSHLPKLEQLAAMAKRGCKIMLPLMNREIPLIADEWAKPELGSGCVKITPAHDPNDHEVWKRNQDKITLINILNTDGTMNKNAGDYQGLDRFEVRKKLVDDLDKAGLLHAIEDRIIEVGHSDRSKTPVEPFISKQWFVRMGDIDGGIICGKGTDKEFKSPGLAQAAIDAVDGDWKSPTNRELGFHPDPTRYANTYLNWLSEKRDWCISRQLWWGHQIPIWHGSLEQARAQAALEVILPAVEREDLCARLVLADGTSELIQKGFSLGAEHEEVEIYVCLRGGDGEKEFSDKLSALGLDQDPDVLDTWFSSGLWPHATLGWPDPETAKLTEGQLAVAAQDGAESALDYYYPGSCLVTGRDIITLWVARMALMGLYNLGDVPFTDCFLHANILDGKGVRMSKSKGNGVDPVDIIESYGADAMRYVICDLQTGSQDIRLPVQAISPFTGDTIELATAKHGSTIYTYLCPKSGKEFDVLGSMEGMPKGKLICERFEIGRNFCNKLWNAVRFALINLQDVQSKPLSKDDLQPEDRWILSRLQFAANEVHAQLEAYNPSAALAQAREFFWSEVCDWYLELIKPRMRDEAAAPVARQVLAYTIDQVLRLLHPFVPFITEALWDKLNEQVPERVLDQSHGCSEIVAIAQWPTASTTWTDSALEKNFELLQSAVKGIREIRAKYTIAPKERLEARIKAQGDNAKSLESCQELIANMAGLSKLEITDQIESSMDSASAILEEIEIQVVGVVDLKKELEDLDKQSQQLSKGVSGINNKLQNQSFVDRAPAEVVERERERLGELQTQLEAVNEKMATIQAHLNQ